MGLGEFAEKHPNAVSILMNYGLHCIGCHAAAFETIEQGAKSHGMDDKQIEKMINEINELIEKGKK